MVKCPRGTSSQVKANLAYIRRPSVFSFDSNFFSWIYDPVKGQMVCVGERDNEVLGPDSEESELDSNKADKRMPPTARDELVYFFISCFLDILLESWEGKPCTKPKMADLSLMQNESEEFGEDFGPCDPSTKSSMIDQLKDLYQKRSSSLSKEKLKKDSVSSESEYMNEEDFEAALPFEPVRGPVPDEDVNLSFANGAWYKGRVSRRLPEGEGIYFWEDGGSFEGDFEGGCATGKGRLQFPDLSVYEGGVYKAFRHGEGMFCFADSQVMYSGQWWLGKKHGHGLIVYNDPSEGHNYYKGEWQNGVKEGFGLRQYPSGARYIGFWSGGQRNGKGVMLWSNNDIYRGHWQGGLMHGYGEYTWNGFINRTLSYPANNFYRGFWAAGKRNGAGIFEPKNGAIIETCWVDNMKQGMGAVVCTNGSIIVAEPLFTRDRQTVYELQEEQSGLLIKNQLKLNRRNANADEHLVTYVLNIEKAKSVSIPIHSPVHTLVLVAHTKKLLEQKELLMLQELEKSSSKSQVVRLTPEIKSPEGGTGRSDAGHLTEEQHCHLSTCLLQEEKNLRNYIMHKMSALRACYDYYATYACEGPTNYKCVLLRIFLWQMLMDSNITSSNHSLVDIDNILAREECLLLDSPHHPFERIRFWQFLHILIFLSWHFYGQYVLVEGLIENQKVSEFLEFYKNSEYKSILKTAFEYFLESDVFWGRFREDVRPPPSRGNHFQESDLAPLEGMYAIYCDVGEPHSAREFVNAICGQMVPTEKSLNSRYIEKLPMHTLEGKNALIVAGELRHIPGSEPFNFPKIFQLERKSIYERPKVELTNLRNLKPRRIVRCLVEVCPGICSEGDIVNMDYQLTFIEFYKTVIQCVELQLKIKAMNEIRANVIAEYKSQMEDYVKQMNEYEKLKESSAVSRKKSRQFSDVSKKGRK